MKQLFLVGLFFFLKILATNAQQKIDKEGMNYVIALKPNSIFYHDTLYSGSKQFEGLFYRTRDNQLIRLVEKHQSNKIAGQILAITGSIATIFGISRVTSSGSDKGNGWVLACGGFAVTLTGGYLTMMGQRNLAMAVTLFNKKYHQTTLGIGVANSSVGLVYKF